MSKSIFSVFTGALSLLLLNSCSVHVEPELTMLQVREIQTRDFDCQDAKRVVKAMMNVLQDEGFIIKNVVPEVGLLNAERIIDIESSLEAYSAKSNDGPLARWNKQKILEASANVTEFGNRVRVRINFQTKILDNLGGLQKIEANQDPLYYQAFFDKVNRGLFIEHQGI